MSTLPITTSSSVWSGNNGTTPSSASWLHSQVTRWLALPAKIASGNQDWAAASAGGELELNIRTSKIGIDSQDISSGNISKSKGSPRQFQSGRGRRWTARLSNSSRTVTSSSAVYREIKVRELEDWSQYYLLLLPAFNTKYLQSAWLQTISKCSKSSAFVRFFTVGLWRFDAPWGWWCPGQTGWCFRPRLRDRK